MSKFMSMQVTSRCFECDAEVIADIPLIVDLEKQPDLGTILDENGYYRYTCPNGHNREFS